MWESIMNIPSLPSSHFSSCCCESTLSLCTPISILLLCYWPPTYSYSCCLSLWLWSIGSWHTWHSRHAYYWLPAFFIKSCIRLLWEVWDLGTLGRRVEELSGILFRVGLWVRVPLETLYERKHPDDKGLSLYWYAIETKAVAGYQWMQESCHFYKITWMTLVHQQDVYRL